MPMYNCNRTDTIYYLRSAPCCTKNIYGIIPPEAATALIPTIRAWSVPTKAFKSDCISRYTYYGLESLLLMAITEADWQFEPYLTCEGSTGPDRLNILNNQTLHNQNCNLIMYLQKIPACFDCFRIVDLAYMLRVSFRNFYIHGYLRGKLYRIVLSYTSCCLSWAYRMLPIWHRGWRWR